MSPKSAVAKSTSSSVSPSKPARGKSPQCRGMSAALRKLASRCRQRPLAAALLLTGSLALATAVSVRADDTWTGGTNSNWSSAGNWNSGVPTAAPYGTLFFSTTANSPSNDDISSLSENKLLFNTSGSFTINGIGAISLYDNNGTQPKIENNNGSTSGTFTLNNSNITFAANNSNPINPFGEINAVTGDILFGTNNTLIVNGSSVNGIKMFGGGHNTAFNGTVSATGKYFATTASSDTIAIGGTFNSGDFYLMNSGVLNLSGSGFTTTALRLGGDFGTTGSQNLAQGGIFNLVDAAGGQTFAATINPVANNTGTLQINSQNSSGINTLSGNIFLDSNLAISQSSGGTLNITNATLDLKNQTLALAGNGGIINITGVIGNSTGSGKLVVGTNGIAQSGGTVTLSSGNTYTGTTSINAGILNAVVFANGAAASSIGISSSAAGNLVFGGGTLQYTGMATATTDRLFTIGNTAGDTATLDASGSGALSFNNTGNIGFGDTNAHTLTLTGTNTGANTLAPVIGNNTGLTAVTKSGAGTWNLNGANTYTGTTTINAGTLAINTLTNNTTANSLGKGSSTGTSLIFNGGTLQYLGTTTGTTNRDFTLGGNFALDASGVGKNGTLSFIGGGANSTIAFGTAAPITLTLTGTNTSSNLLALNLGDSGTGSNITSLNKTGVGTWILSGANTYSGGTIVSGGVLSGTTTSIQRNVNNTATLDFTQNTAGKYAGTISGGGAVTVGGQSGGGGVVTFTAANTYSGGTNISSSNTLSVTTSGAGTAAIVDNGTLDLGGSSGTLSNTVSGSGGVTVGGNSTNNAVASAAVITFTGTNSYSGGTTVNAPTGSTATVSGNAGSYGAGAITVNSRATVDYTQSGTGTAANTISGAGNASFGGAASPSANGSGGTINYTGQDSATGGTTVSSGTVVLNRTGGSALTGPVAVATSSTLQLGTTGQAANSNNGQIASTSNVTLSGGTLAAHGQSEGSTTTNPTTMAVTPNAGLAKLTLVGTSSVLDFGDPNGTAKNIFAFSDSVSTLAQGGVKLTLANYTNGADQLYIGSTNDLSQAQLSDISFGTFITQQASNGLITFGPAAAPEPSGVATFAFVFSLPAGLVVLRRRYAKKQKREQSCVRLS